MFPAANCRPQTTPADLATATARPCWSGGTRALLVRSWAAPSSSKAACTRRRMVRRSRGEASPGGIGQLARRQAEVASPGRVGLGEVAAVVGAAAFPAALGGGGDETPDEGHVGQGDALQPGGRRAPAVDDAGGEGEAPGVADDAGVLPEQSLQGGLVRRGGWAGQVQRFRPFRDGGRGLRLPRGLDRALREDHRLQQGVAGQAVGAVHAGARHLAAGEGGRAAWCGRRCRCRRRP